MSRARTHLWASVCAENLYSTILVMKAAENRSGCDCAHALSASAKGQT